MTVVYGAKNFKTGLNITFKVMHLNGSIFGTYTTVEIGNTGVYFYNIPFVKNKEYVVGVIEPAVPHWTAFKHIVT